MAYEKPTFKLIEKKAGYSIVEIQLMIVAYVDLDVPYAQATNTAFSILGGYIFGNNISKHKIDMTAPVTIQDAPSEEIAMTVPVTQEVKNGKQRVSFMMPSEYSLETLPKPKDERIIFEEIPTRKAAVYRFSGTARKARIDKKKMQFKKQVKADGHITEGEPIFARYDAPQIPPFLRTNELWLYLKK